MKNGNVVILVILSILVGGTAVYYVESLNTQTTPPPPSRPQERFILAASCSPAGSTGTIIATNIGVIPVNLTEMFVRYTNGSQITSTFPHGRVIQPSASSTLSQGIAYLGSNVTISAVSEFGNIFTTTCATTGKQA
jgi:hypothetical protein